MNISTVAIYKSYNFMCLCVNKCTFLGTQPTEIECKQVSIEIN